MDKNSTAYHIVYWFGYMLIPAIMLGLGVFFIIALVKAIRTGRRGWIIGAAVSGLPFVAVFILFLVGIGIGISQIMHRTHLAQAGRHGAAALLLTAAMSPVQGDSLPYTISLPWVDNWGIKNDDTPYDHVFSYKYGPLYVGVIAEAFGGGSPEHVCDFAQQHTSRMLSKVRFTDPKPVTIDHAKWLTFDASGTLNSGVDVKYRYYIYADNLRSVQIIGWSGPLQFDSWAPVMDRVADSFQFQR